MQPKRGKLKRWRWPVLIGVAVPGSVAGGVYAWLGFCRFSRFCQWGVARIFAAILKPTQAAMIELEPIRGAGLTDPYNQSGVS